MPYAFPRRGVTLSTQALADKQRNAENSPLLRLPGELRNHIVDLGLTSETTLRLRAVSPPPATYAFVPMATPVLRLADKSKNKNLLALLSVCRQLQEEAYMVVFKENTFAVVEGKEEQALKGLLFEIRSELVGQPSLGFADQRPYMNVGPYLSPEEITEIKEVQEEMRKMEGEKEEK